ncbi:hypothetical protein [Sulfurimonas sp.]|uniref:hypothetical protein n=1 Tax=Sulfurimonas sp. TaxID=2022749 RepID=UPI0025E3A545|nr:hypothetical protein [Sulfurimonas sp.]
MLKKINIFMFYILLSLSLDAKEPVLAILNNTVSNEVQNFTMGKYTFECRAYGLLTLEKLYNSSKVGSVCRNEIVKFYKKNPKLEYYADSLLENRQEYHVEIKNTQCILYARGQMTLSELLLVEGLAVLKPKFKDEEFESYFTLAQKRAKIDKKGLWGEKIFSSCIEELYK